MLKKQHVAKRGNRLREGSRRHEFACALAAKRLALEEEGRSLSLRSRIVCCLGLFLIMVGCQRGERRARGVDAAVEPPPALADTEQQGLPTGLVAEPDSRGVLYSMGFASEVIASGFDQGVAFAFTPDGSRIFVAEKRGSVKVVFEGRLLEEPFVDLSDAVNATDDRGLLGIAVHPEFPEKPYVYLAHTYDPPETRGASGGAGSDGRGARVARVVRVEADAEGGFVRARQNSEVVLLGANGTFSTIGRADARNDYEPPSCGRRGSYVEDCLPADETSHTIGALAFGPDGALYVANGDGCDFTRAQPACTRALDLDSLAGKILRLDPITGAGLRDNPFAEEPLTSNRSKVYQLGLRNPFRMAFDRVSGALYVGDVGWNAWEELNRGGPGANFGWPCYEGGNGVNLEQPNYRDSSRCLELGESGEPTVPALYAYAHEEHGRVQGSAILMGDVYRGTTYPPLYRGALFYSDFNRRQLRFVSLDAQGQVASSQVFAEGIGYHTQITSHPTTHDLYVLQIGIGTEAPESKLERLVFRGYGSAPREGRLYKLRTGTGTSCLEAAPGPSNFESAGVVKQEPCRPDPAQRFLLESMGAESYRLLAETTGEAITVKEASDGTAAIELAYPDGRLAQQFRFLLLGSGHQIITEGQEWCLSAPADRPHAAIVAEPCASTSAQIFAIASEDNRRPTMAPIADVTMTVGTMVELRIEASDPEQTELTYFASGLPPSLSIDPLSGLIMGELTRPGMYSVRVRVTDGELAETQPFRFTVQDDKLPNVELTAPAEGFRYVAGERVEFAARALDRHGVPIAAERLSWELFSHHNQHVHFNGLPPTRGDSGAFIAEDHGDNTSLELCAVAIDGESRVGRACRVLLPMTVEYTIDSVPSGLRLPWDGVARETPFTVQTNVGGKRDLVAPPVQNGSYFVSWSDGGRATHTITIGNEPQRLLATYASFPAESASEGQLTP